MASATDTHDHSHAPTGGGNTVAQVLTREPLVLNNRSLNWITEKVCGIVEKPQPKYWWYLIVPSFLLTLVLVGCFTYLIATGIGVGDKSPSGLVLGYYQFRVLDRDWSRGNLDFGDSLFDPTKVADFGESRCGSDDVVRGGLCGYFPCAARGPGLDGVFLGSDSE
jgi:hypothetical protein